VVERSCLARLSNHLNNGKAKLLGKIPVARIMGRNGHYGAGAIGNKDIIADPDGNSFAIYGIDRVRSSKDTGLVLS